MKSFNLNKTMRESVARQITTKAIHAELSNWTAEAVRINNMFWEKHCAKVVEAGLDKKLWDIMIQKHIVNGVVRIEPELQYEYKNGNEVSIHSKSVKLLDRDKNERFYNSVDISKITGMSDFFKKGYYSMELLFSSPKSVPNISRSTIITLSDDLHQPITDLAERFVTIYHAAMQCHRQTMSVLSSCRTSRQLENIFPEAAKLLPQPEQKIVNEVAPAELVSSIQAMLKQGISTAA
jgi:hypothetical protein